jgi:membrane peptidoglycan carboxypeptidase
VYTFFDRDTQDTVIETVTNPEYLIKNVSGAAADNLVIACSPDGRVSALHTNNRLLPTAKRNFASALKPLVVYAPAIETGTVNADTEIMDEPYAAGDFKPKNHDGKFHGTVTVREAITNSYNVPAVKILEYTTVARAVDVAKGLGLPLGDENLSLALGNVSNGVTAYQVLGGYCAIVNGGFLTTPSLIKRIENANGSVVWEYTNPHVRALSAHTAATVTDLLQSVVKQGTARKMAAIGFDIAGKTGTAERIGTGTNTDAVNISFTPTNVLLVWNGNASMTEKCDLPRGTSGGGITTYVARDIMKHINKDKAEFKKAEKANRNDKVDTEAKGKTTPADTTAVSAATKKLSVPTLKIDGAVGENGAPRLTFKTEKGTKYECYRAISGTPTVLQVVGGSGDEHTFYDNTAPANTIIEYWVCDKSQRSNTLKIYSPKQINRDAKAKSKSKQWWF